MDIDEVSDPQASVYTAALAFIRGNCAYAINTKISGPGPIILKEVRVQRSGIETIKYHT